jgi:DNA polymerase-3 subunit epsilon
MTVDGQQSDGATGLDELACKLVASGDYRVLRRLTPRKPTAPAAGHTECTGIVLDVETTGLDVARDEIIELAMVKFRYRPNGEITAVSEIFQGFNEPAAPIPPAITRLTGISDDMVAGRQIETSTVEAFIGTAEILIAHVSRFDRPFVERAWNFFADKPWACSAHEIDWKAYGFSGAKLTYLSMEAGFFYGAHRAVDDCHAVVELLSRPLPGTSATALSVLLDRAARSSCRVWAEYAPFDLKDVLKARGYRWSNGENGALRCWYVDVDESEREAELRFLREEIYQRNVDLRCVTYTALERHSARIAPPARVKLPAGRSGR